MKKHLSLILFGAIFILGINTVFAQSLPQSKDKPPIEQHQKMKQDFEKRLNLSKKQKEKAKAIHQKGAQQMKPLMKQMETLRKSINETKKSNLDEKSKNEKLKKDITELRLLEKKAHEIRKQNSQEFEKILNKKQKKELEKMKLEGRKKFAKEHKPRPPFNMFNPEPWNNRRIPTPLLPPPPPPVEYTE